MGVDMRLVAHVAVEDTTIYGFNVLDTRVLVGEWRGAEVIHDKFMELYDPHVDGTESIHVPHEFLHDLEVEAMNMCMVGASNDQEKKLERQYQETFAILKRIRDSGIMERAYFCYSYSV